MADLTLTSPIATRTLTLATTCKVIEVSRETVGGLQGLYLYCTTETLYQILADGQSVASGAAAPTADYDVVPASTKTPIGITPHTDGLTTQRPLRIAVWVASGTPTLHVAPYPVTR